MKSITSLFGSGTKRNVLISILTQGMNSFVSATQFVIVGRILGAEGLGLWSAIVSLVVIVTGFVNLGLYIPVGRDVARSPESASKLIGVALGIILTMVVPSTIVLSVSSGWLVGYRDLVLFSVLLMAISISLRSIGSLLSSVTQAFNHFEWDFLVRTIGRVGGLMLLVPALITFPAVTTVISVNAISWFIILVLFLFFLSRVVSPIRPISDWGVGKDLIREAVPITLASAMATIGIRVDNLIIERTIGSAQAGVYTAAYSFFLIGAAFLFAMTVGLFPSFARLNSNTIRTRSGQLGASFRGLYLKSILVIAGIGVLGTLLVWLIGGQMLILVYGEEFSNAVVLLRILALGFPLVAISRTSYQALNASGNQINSFVAFAAGAGFNLVANIILIPTYGAIAASIIAIATEVIIAILAVYLIARSIGTVT